MSNNYQTKPGKSHHGKENLGSVNKWLSNVALIGLFLSLPLFSGGNSRVSIADNSQKCQKIPERIEGNIYIANLSRYPEKLSKTLLDDEALTMQARTDLMIANSDLPRDE